MKGRLSEGKAMIDEISTKIDKLETEKDSIKKKCDEEVIKYSRLSK